MTAFGRIPPLNFDVFDLFEAFTQQLIIMKGPVVNYFIEFIKLVY